MIYLIYSKAFNTANGAQRSKQALGKRRLPKDRLALKGKNVSS